jgi:hypothetical protein
MLLLLEHLLLGRVHLLQGMGIGVGTGRYASHGSWHASRR